MKLFKVLKTFFFVITGCLLLWITVQKVNVIELKQALWACFNWKLLFVFIASIGVVFLRAKRWQLLYQTQQVSVTTTSLFHVLNIGYLVNFAVPRLGELSRAALLKDKYQIQFNQSIASIIFERLTDLFVLALILVSALIVEDYLKEGMIFGLMKGFNFHLYLLVVIAVLILFFALLFYYFKQQIQQKLNVWFQELIAYFGLLFQLKQKLTFIYLSIGIWLGFYLMTMLWIFIYPNTSHVSFFACFEVMLVGVLARTLPIQAGSAGAYHFVVSSAFVYFGLNESTAFTLAILIHGFQSILTILLGVVSYIWLIYQQKYA